MSVRTYSSPAPGAPPQIEIHNPAGTVTVEAVEGCSVLDVWVEALNPVAEQLLDSVQIDATQVDPGRVDEPVRLQVRTPPLRLRTASFAVRVTVPLDTTAQITVASADVEVRGRMGRVAAAGASGDIAVEHCTDISARCASGDVRVGTVTGGGTIASASGDVRVQSVAGTFTARTASGDISVGVTEGTVSLASASGDMEVGAAGRGRVQLKTMSGDAGVGVLPGLRVWLDLGSVSGRMDSQLDDDESPSADAPELSISARTMSGDVVIRRAAAPVPAV